MSEIKVDTVYVLDKDEIQIAVFNKDDEDTLINPVIEEVQNKEAIFKFSLPLTSNKWQQVSNPENLYVVDGKVFSTNFDGAFTLEVTEDNEDVVNVIAYEREKLLERQYVRAWNSETGFEKIDTFMVVILARGNLPLKNNGNQVQTSHLPGTSGYVLDALLYGTGWTTGTCDVEGFFDLETDQVDIYNNILKVQEIWGGILVFDSINKVVHHRDETKFLPYDGYEVRYQKNMQSLENTLNNKIITELCPLGEGGLNIASVNDGSVWLKNYSYTNSKLQGIENNVDITDQAQLKQWGERKLKDLCKPRKELVVKTVLLHQLEGYKHESIHLNDIVDVLEYEYTDTIEQLRVVSFVHKIWDYSDAEITLSDVTLDSTDIFKKTVSATNSINNGTINSKQIVDFFNNGESLSQSLQRVDRLITENKADLTKSDTEIKASISSINTLIDELNGIIVSQNKQIADLELTIDGLKTSIETSGGSNLLRNSTGFFGNEYWEGNIFTNDSNDVQNNNISKTALNLQGTSIAQSLNNLKNGKYNISFNYKKTIALANASVKIGQDTYSLTNTSWTEFEKVIEVTNHSFNITFTSDTNNSCLIGDLLLIFGEYKQTWTQNSDETQTDTVSIGKGIQVDSNVMNTYTRIDADGERTFNKDTREIVKEATDKGMGANYYGPVLDKNGNKKDNSGEFGGILIQKMDNQTWISSLL